MMTTVHISRPFPSMHVDELWYWLNSPRSPNFDDFGPKSIAEFAMHFKFRQAHETTWAIRCGEMLCGYLAFLQYSPMCGQFHGMVISPEYRRKGVGEAAFRSAINELHSDGLKKLIVWTFADNAPILRLISGVGFVQEGLIKAATERQQKPLDMVLWGKEAE